MRPVLKDQPARIGLTSESQPGRRNGVRPDVDAAREFRMGTSLITSMLDWAAAAFHRRPARGTQVPAAESDGVSREQALEAARLRRIRAQIAAGVYLTPDKLNVVVDRLHLELHEK